MPIIVTIGGIILAGSLIFSGLRRSEEEIILTPKKPASRTSKRKTISLDSAPPPALPVSESKSALVFEYEQLSSELNKIKQKILKLTDSYAGGVIREETYKVLMEDYQKQENRLENMITEARAQIEAELNALQKEEIEISKQVELLSAKKIVEDISEGEYTIETSGLNAKLAEIRQKRSELEQVLESRCQFCGSVTEGYKFCMKCGRVLK